MCESRELPSPTWDGAVQPPQLEEYAVRYKDAFVFERRNGVLQVQMQTDGGPPAVNYGMHSTWGLAWQEIGNDPENEVMILTSTGDQFTGHNPEAFARMHTEWSSYEWYHLFQDGLRMIENLITAIDFPTIGAINGPGFAHQMPLVCDITLCSENTVFSDAHFLGHTVPGDGLGLSYQELIGSKRASYYMYTGQTFDAEQALAWGLVNEVLPQDQLLPRAWELAEMIRKRPLWARRFTSSVVKRVWKRRFADDLGFHLVHEGFAGRMDGGPVFDEVDGL